MLIATKNKGEVKLEDFQPLVKEKVVKAPKPKFDLTLKNGLFTIGEDFLEGQSEDVAWNAGVQDGKAYLLKNTTPETLVKMRFLKGAKPLPSFRGSALLGAISAVGLNLEQPFALTKVEGLPNTEGLETYEISNVSVANTVVEAPVVVQEESASAAQLEAEAQAESDPSLHLTDEQLAELSRDPAVEELTEPQVVENLL